MTVALPSSGRAAQPSPELRSGGNPNSAALGALDALDVMLTAEDLTAIETAIAATEGSDNRYPIH